jgi:hypothetical protein
MKETTNQISQKMIEDRARGVAEDAVADYCIQEIKDDMNGCIDQYIHESIGGMDWVIYYAKARMVVDAASAESREQAEENLSELGAVTILRDRGFDGLASELAYEIMMVETYKAINQIIEEGEQE